MWIVGWRAHSTFELSIMIRIICGKVVDAAAVVVVVDLSFTMLLTSQVISITFYSERKKSDKFCSEALILA